MDSQPAQKKPAAQRPLLGKRIEVCGLLSKADLNGRQGLAMTFDAAKRRYRVRLDAHMDEDSKVLAFKADNLRMVS